MSRKTRSYQNLFAELKRRQVFKVAAVYGATAFVVMQAADFLVPALRLSDAIASAIALVAVLGFPLALVLAWALELTPTGVQRTAPTVSGELEAIVAQPRSRRWPAGILALVGITLLGGGGWWVLRPGSSGGGPYDSIAVLPFVNLSDDPGNEYFSDGLAEELINALTAVEGLKVAARTSAFAFKGQDADVREIGRALDVATVLEGSVRKAGDRVRITAQLINVGDGFHLWSETYDRRLNDIFAVQDEISRSIVDALSVSLGASAEERGLFLGGTDDVEAYELYLRGRQRWVTRRPDQLHLALNDFEAAVARDSSFALAWSGLADAIDALAWREPEARPLVPRGLAAARRALALEPGLAEGYASLGVLLFEFERDYAEAERALRRAVELKPGYATARHFYGALLRSIGRLPEALEQHGRAVRLDPLSGVIQDSYGQTLSAARRREEAREQYRRASSLPQPVPDSDFSLVVHGREFGLTAAEAADAAERWARLVDLREPVSARVIGAAVIDTTLRSQAVSALTRLDEEAREQSWYSHGLLAEFWIVHGEIERSLQHLERALEEDDPRLAKAGVEPNFDPLRENPRFLKILEALDLPNGYFPDR